MLFGAWAAGLVPAYGDAGGDAVVHVVGPDPLAAEPSGGTVLACSLRPLGGRFTEPLPSGWLDFAVEVPPQPDLLLMPAPVTSATPATTSSSADVTHGGLVQAGLVRAGELGLAPGGRLATDLNPADPATMAAAIGHGFASYFVGCLAIGGDSRLVVRGPKGRALAVVDRNGHRLVKSVRNP